MKTMKVVIPGVLTTVQDLGRFGYQKSGMTCSGVMDMAAYRKANYLVGNEEGAAVLEMTLYGGSCRFEEDTVIALTGADMQPTVNQKPIAMNQAVKVPAGGVLNLGMAKTGCRAYLAVAGGFEVPKVMGSYSTNLKCGIGGHEGRALQMGDELPIGEALHSWDEVKGRKVSVPDYPKEVLVSVVPGPQEEYFTEAGIHHFYSESYEVTESCDRMGYRLEGPEVESKNGTDIVSDGIVFGSIQIPSSGKPIILMADQIFRKWPSVSRETGSDFGKCRWRKPRRSAEKNGKRSAFNGLLSYETTGDPEADLRRGDYRTHCRHERRICTGESGHHSEKICL